MKKNALKGFSFFMILGLFIQFSSCNSGSKSKTDSSVSKEQVTSDVIEGVFEYASPLQGYAIMFDNHYLYVFGNSDSTMYCHGGKYEISGDTITNTVLFAMNPNQVGNTFQWLAEESGDTLKVAVIDKDGNISQMAKSVRKVKLDENTTSQLKKFEGSYNYVSGGGGGILLSGYGVYLSQSSGGAGTYVEKNDTVTFKRLFSTNPDLIGKEITWVNESLTGDTLNWATINGAGEVLSRGQSVYLK